MGQANSAHRPSRRLLGVLAALTFGVLCAGVAGELLSYAYFSYLGGDLGRPTVEGRIGEYDPQLGYRLLPNATARLFGPEFDTVVRINAQGLRQVPAVPYERTPGKARVLIAGDSYTFGHGVNDGERFSELLATRLPDTEVVNMGVAGTGTDQQYLLYAADGVKYAPDLVILCYMIENIRRNGNNARLGPGDEIIPKPQFVVRDGTLTLTNVPVPEKGQTVSDERRALEELHSTGVPIPFKRFFQEHSYLYRFIRLRLAAPLKQLLRSNPTPYPEYDPSRAEWQVTTALFKQFASDARAHGSRFLLVTIPSPEYVFMDWLDDRPYRMIDEFCRAEHMDCLDLRPAILAATTAGEALYFPLDGHWTRAGHVLAAKLISDYLAGQPGEALIARRAVQPHS